MQTWKKLYNLNKFIVCMVKKKGKVDILIPAKSFCIGKICIDYLNL